MSMENLTETAQPPNASGKDLDQYSADQSRYMNGIYGSISQRVNWLLDRYKSKSFDSGDSPISVGASTSFYLVDTTSGDVTANLPAASSNENIMFHFKNTGTGVLTVDATELIDNCDTIELIEMETITVVSDGSAYWIVP
jgi:hypothetical protein